MERQVLVTLMGHTPDPEYQVALAARMCYSPLGAKELKEKLTPKEVERLIKKILAMNHESVLEMASFSFAIEGISRVTSHQLVRHRIGSSYAQKSQRYLQETQFNYIIPTGVKESPKGERIFMEAMAYCQDSYNRLLELGIHQEEARYLLPNAVETKLFVTMNARSLRHFFRLRCCQRAQGEIRRLAYCILKEVKKISPLLFQGAGPPCMTGTCPEGDLSCGHIGRGKG